VTRNPERRRLREEKVTDVLEPVVRQPEEERKITALPPGDKKSREKTSERRMRSERKNCNTKREDNREKDLQEDDRNVIL
jgi:hypothetical protein